MKKIIIIATGILLSLSLTSCSSISKATKYAPKNDFLYSNNVEHLEKRPENIGWFIGKCTYIVEATYINIRNVVDEKIPRSYEVFKINQEIKGTNELFTKEMSVLMCHDEAVHKILVPGNKYILFVEASDLSYMPEPEYIASVFFPLTDNNQIQVRDGYISGTRFDSLDESDARKCMVEMLTDLDEKFFTDPINTLLKHPYIHEQIMPVIDHLIPQSYPDIDTMIEASDVIVIARFEKTGTETAWHSDRYDFELVGEPLLTGSFEGTPSHIMLPFTPEDGEEYVLFLREIIFNDNQIRTYDMIYYDFISRESSCIARQDIPDWENFIRKIK